MSFTRNIREAQSHFWPTVRDSIERHKASRASLERNASPAAQARARRPLFRVVFDETIWALAKAHRLNTAEQAQVIEAACAWAKVYGELEEPEKEDRDLYRAVQEMRATFEPEDVDAPLLTVSAH
jgi:hypothetical protein